ncbi:hypothetical protein HPP92_016052 [Vanilla planifolia]|uniref:peptidylprolyl isomerase n=1 Tax=Vanilla planifolia TaxID=51239 RepID=A0A835QPV2_VANPL|nr:hypothetical protein HPP92_016052 [Vanilla planifolia]
MAFWGVEVRPGKPFTHNFDESRGRLRITQATLSDGKSTGKSIMQCNVGNKSPVLLCSLIPNLSETCHLELEFEEDEKVTFSVLGQRSIHLAGYFLSHGHNLGGGDSDSHGEDIAESDTSGSYSHGSEDEYESDFIDDGDIEIYSDFPVHKSSVVIEEIEDEDKLSNVNRKLLRLRKKYEHSDPVVTETGTKQLIVSNNESGKVVSEDEDGFPILFSMGGENFKNKKINRDKKRKIDGVIQDNVPLSDEATENHGLLVPSEVATDVKKKI